MCDTDMLFEQSRKEECRLAKNLGPHQIKRFSHQKEQKQFFMVRMKKWTERVEKYVASNSMTKN